MSCYSGPEIVNNGLVFHYDMNNTQKSWKGAPTTNLLGNPFCLNNTGPTFFAYTNYEATTSIVPAFNSAMSAISPYWIKFVKTSATNGRMWFLGVSGLTIGIDYTYSAYVYTEDSNLTSIYLGSDNSGVSYITSSLLTWNTTYKGAVRRIASIFRTYNGNQVQGCRVNSTDPIGTTFYMAAFQCEQASTASTVVSGTRTTTQAILDLTKNNTITVSNLSYSSDNTFSFDGTDDYISLGQPSILNNMTSGSMCVWFKRTATNATYQMLFTDGYSNLEFCFYVNGFQFYLSNSNIGTYGGLSSLNTWYNVVGTWDVNTNTRSLYVNGINVVTNTCSVTSGSGYDRYIGGRGASLPFTGAIPLIQIYNRALSALEIKQNFEATRGRYGI